MGKRLTITTTRQDPSTPWFMENALPASVEQAVTSELAFLTEHLDTITFDQTSTDTTLTVTFDFSDNAIFDQYATLIANNLETPYKDYCAANNMTITKDITDI